MSQPQTLIAVDPDKLDALARDVQRLHARLDAVQMTAGPEWLTVKDYAAHVGKTTRTIRNWIEEGKVETKQDGAVKFVRVNQVA